MLEARFEEDSGKKPSFSGCCFRMKTMVTYVVFFRHCAQQKDPGAKGLPLTPCREWVHFPVRNLRVDFRSSGNV